MKMATLLNKSNPHCFVYARPGLKIEMLGGIRIDYLDWLMDFDANKYSNAAVQFVNPDIQLNKTGKAVFITGQISSYLIK